MGDGDLGFFEGGFDVAEEGLFDFGVVFDFEPDPEFAFGGVDGEVVDAEAGGGVFENEFIVFDGVADEGEGVFGVVFVGEGDGEFDHADAVVGVIDKHVIPQNSVGDEDAAVIERVDFGAEEAGTFDRAFGFVGFDPIANFKGAVGHEHEAAGDVAEGAFECQTNGDTGGT